MNCHRPNCPNEAWHEVQLLGGGITYLCVACCNDAERAGLVCKVVPYKVPPKIAAQVEEKKEYPLAFSTADDAIRGLSGLINFVKQMDQFIDPATPKGNTDDDDT
jgi:hypothetical protein